MLEKESVSLILTCGTCLVIVVGYIYRLQEKLSVLRTELDLWKTWMEETKKEQKNKNDKIERRLDELKDLIVSKL